MTYLIQRMHGYSDSIGLTEEIPDAFIRLSCIAKIELTPEEYAVANSMVGRALFSVIFFAHWRKNSALEDESVLVHHCSSLMQRIAKLFREAAAKGESQQEGYRDEDE